MDPVGWFYSLPPITRTWFGLSLAVNAAVTLELIPPDQLLFDADRLYPKLELWRLATCFLYGGGPLYELYVAALKQHNHAVAPPLVLLQEFVFA